MNTFFNCSSSVRGRETSIPNEAAKLGIVVGEKAGQVGKMIKRLYQIWCDLCDLVSGDIPTAKHPNNLCMPDVDENAKRFLHERLESHQVIAAGGSGDVFRCVKEDGTKAVVKVQIGSTEHIKHEIETQKHFHRKGLAPKILAHCSFKHTNRLSASEHERPNKIVQDGTVPFQTEVGGPDGNVVHIIIMEEIAGVIGNWLSRLKSKAQLAQVTLEIFELVKSLRENDLTHADLHIYNIGYVYTDSSKNI